MIMMSSNSVRYTVQLSPEMKEAFIQKARKEGFVPSAYMRWILAQILKKAEKEDHSND
jgi:hypothetical protein